MFACLLLRCVKAIIIPCIIHPSSIPSSIFRILHFARVKIANIFTPLYLLMEIETEETFYGRDKRGKCDVSFFFSLIRDNDYLAPRNQRIKESRATRGTNVLK